MHKFAELILFLFSLIDFINFNKTLFCISFRNQKDCSKVIMVAAVWMDVLASYFSFKEFLTLRKSTHFNSWHPIKIRMKYST